MSTTGENELVVRCRADDPAAWNELVERFSRYVFAIATRAFGLSEHDAEDVFQEVFARTYARIDTLHDDSSIRPWLAQLTRRLSIDHLRTAGREISTDGLPDAASPDEQIERIGMALDVHDAMRRLPEQCHAILERFFKRDQSYQTISAELQIPPGTVASRISRCLAKLRAELEADQSIAR